MGKLGKLKEILSQLGSVVVAYSGGLDSTFLAKVAKDVLGDKVLAVTAVSATYPKEELVAAKALAAKLGLRHRVIATDELKDVCFRSNPWNRCYFCKRELFKKLTAIAKNLGYRVVVDGSNISDKLDLRPGDKAKKEFGVRSPLLEAGFTKSDIRRYCRRFDLDIWDKPAQACLASRIPYGRPITPEVIQKIYLAERYLKQLGLKQVRLRHYEDLCRIEVMSSDFSKVISVHKRIVTRLKQLGYRYITLDLQGYRSGSMNEIFD